MIAGSRRRMAAEVGHRISPMTRISRDLIPVSLSPGVLCRGYILPELCPWMMPFRRLSFSTYHGKMAIQTGVKDTRYCTEFEGNAPVDLHSTSYKGQKELYMSRLLDDLWTRLAESKEVPTKELRRLARLISRKESRLGVCKERVLKLAELACEHRGKPKADEPAIPYEFWEPILEAYLRASGLQGVEKVWDTLRQGLAPESCERQASLTTFNPPLPAWHVYARAYAQAGRRFAAIRHLEHVMTIYPTANHASTLHLLGMNYVRCHQFEKARACLAILSEKYNRSTVGLRSMLIRELGTLGKMSEAESEFENGRQPAASMSDFCIKRSRSEISLWNSLSYAFLVSEQYNRVDELSAEMATCGVRADIVTWNVRLLAALRSTCSNTEKSDIASKIFDSMRLSGWNPNVVSYSTVINEFQPNTEGLEYGRLWLERAKAELGQTKCTPSLFNALLSKELGHGNGDGVPEIVKQLERLGLRLDSVGENILANYRYSAGVSVDGDIPNDEKNPLSRNTIWTYNTMLGAYLSELKKPSPENMLPRVNALVDHLHQSHVAYSAHTYAMLISILGRLGEVSRADDVYLSALSEGFKPNKYILVALLDAHARNRSLDRAHYVLLTEMPRHGIKPGVEAFTALAYGYARKGRFVDVQRTFHRFRRSGGVMTCASWTVLADACARRGSSSDLKRVLEDACQSDVSLDAGFFAGIARVCIVRQDWRLLQATEMYMKARDITFNGQRFRLAVARSLVSAGKLDQALAFLSKEIGEKEALSIRDVWCQTDFACYGGIIAEILVKTRRWVDLAQLYRSFPSTDVRVTAAYLLALRQVDQLEEADALFLSKDVEERKSIMEIISKWSILK